MSKKIWPEKHKLRVGKIEKDVSLPIGHRLNRKYPLALMKVGDSFLVQYEKQFPDEFTDVARYKLQGKIGSKAYRFGKKNNMKFAVKGEGNGVRCWRVA